MKVLRGKGCGDYGHRPTWFMIYTAYMGWVCMPSQIPMRVVFVIALNNDRYRPGDGLKGMVFYSAIKIESSVGKQSAYLCI
jgi:hypothetical protein